MTTQTIEQIVFFTMGGLLIWYLVVMLRRDKKAQMGQIPPPPPPPKNGPAQLAEAIWPDIGTSDTKTPMPSKQMIPSTYTYSLANDFRDGELNAEMLEIAIKKYIMTPFDRLDYNGDVVQFVFADVLSVRDKNILDGLRIGTGPRPQKPPPLRPQMIPETGLTSLGWFTRFISAIWNAKKVNLSLLTIERREEKSKTIAATQIMRQNAAQQLREIQAPSEQTLAETDRLMTGRINDNTFIGWPGGIDDLGEQIDPEPKTTPNPEVGERKLIL